MPEVKKHSDVFSSRFCASANLYKKKFGNVLCFFTGQFCSGIVIFKTPHAVLILLLHTTKVFRKYQAYVNACAGSIFIRVIMAVDKTTSL